MHFLTLLQASPQFLGSLLANAVGTMRATTRRRLARCIFLWIENRCLQLEDLLHCTTLENICAKRSWEAGWWGLQARHSLHNFCGSALTQPTHLLAPPARLRNCCRAPHSFTPTNGALHCSTLKDLGQTTPEHIHLWISGTAIFIDPQEKWWMVQLNCAWFGFIGYNWSGGGDKTVARKRGISAAPQFYPHHRLPIVELKGTKPYPKTKFL